MVEHELERGRRRCQGIVVRLGERLDPEEGVLHKRNRVGSPFAALPAEPYAEPERGRVADGHPRLGRQRLGEVAVRPEREVPRDRHDVPQEEASIGHPRDTTTAV